MSFKESYIVPKAHFERLLVGKIGKIENMKKKDFNKFRKTRTHRRHTPKAIVSGEDFDNAVPYVDADVRKHSPGKSKKKENAGEYFVPTKKRKVWKLMRFLEKNKDVGIGDDYMVTVGGKEIPGSDFIDIMHFLMKSGGKEDAEKTFYPSLDESMGMPTGTKWFTSALYRSIEKKPLTEKTSRHEKENFATKFKAFAGTATEGVGSVLDEIQQDMHNTTVQVEERNVEDAIDDLEDEIKIEEEQERAR